MTKYSMLTTSWHLRDNQINKSKETVAHDSTCKVNRSRLREY